MIQSLMIKKEGGSYPWDAETSFHPHLSVDFQRCSFTLCCGFHTSTSKSLLSVKGICGNSGSFENAGGKASRVIMTLHFGRKIIMGKRKGSVIVLLQTPCPYAMLQRATAVK